MMITYAFLAFFALWLSTISDFFQLFSEQTEYSKSWNLKVFILNRFINWLEFLKLIKWLKMRNQIIKSLRIWWKKSLLIQVHSYLIEQRLSTLMTRLIELKKNFKIRIKSCKSRLMLAKRENISKLFSLLYLYFLYLE